MAVSAQPIKRSRRAFLSGATLLRTHQSALWERLQREMLGEVYSDPASLGRYSTDASIYQQMPLAVAVPKTRADLRIALDVARDAKIPVLPRGAGTSQCGQTVGQALVLDTSRYLRDVLAFDPQARRVKVEPGMVLDHLNAFLKPHGLWFPVDVSTGAQCTIGGMAGNNSCGSRSLHYGNMVHNVAAIDAVLADGTAARFARFGDGGDMVVSGQRMSSLVSQLFLIARGVRTEMAAVWPKLLRRVGGYNLDIFYPQGERPYTEDGLPNLAHLLVGSEGTLASFEAIELALAPLPQAKVLGVVNFPTFSSAMAVTQKIVGLGPVAVELVDRTMIELCAANAAFSSVIQKVLVADGQTPEALLLVEFAGDDPALLHRQLRDLVTLMADEGLPGSVVEMTEPKAQASLWEVRKAGLNIMMSLRGDGKPVSFIEDCAVPLEHLAEYTAALTEVFARHGTQGTWYAHASVGTLHVRPILDMRRDGAQKMRAIAEEAAELVRRYKGAFSGEHGDGLVRSEWVAWQFGPKITQAFDRVKDAFDPDNRMNPGKIVRSTRMDDRRLFRYGPDYALAPIQPGLDWSAWNVENDPARPGPKAGLGIYVGPPGSGQDPTLGLAKAVEMCNNNGHCRKFDAGTMCPSYRVTREEQHSVRGRANTLRHALSGQLRDQDIAGDAVAQALDLCVGCKGCKRECPTGVDMARMKIEAQYQRGLRHGFSLQDRLVAALPDWVVWARRIPGLAAALNLRNHSPLLARLMQRVTGIAAGRRLPAWQSSQPFADLSDSEVSHAGLADCDLVLWADTFHDGFAPGPIQAAYRLLRSLGYRVALSGAAAETPVCCGRSALSVGMIDQARERARRALQALAPAAARGVPLVGLEPSCILGMRDEWLSLGLGPEADRLAQQTFLIDEWLDREMLAGRIAAAKAPDAQGPLARGQRVLLHGHCHQKALGAFSATERLLRAAGFAVETIAASCCGMAGRFGYEARYQTVSHAMAEDSLLPAIRKADRDALLVADGFSCRHQIHDLAGRDVLHCVELLAQGFLVPSKSVARIAD
ncbi:MAG: FAD-binding oxidoreductase [Betaproteobacteria bacterium]|nr:FAD-binding oxidoreductase [Betaproteobacteria bacterium]